MENLREKYNKFVYDSYYINYLDDGIKVIYKYKISDYIFSPEVFIKKEFINNKNINKEFLEYLFFNFGIINSINYYKLTCAKIIDIKCGYLDDKQKEFFKKLFYNGLGEFMYVNKLNISYDDFLTINTIIGKNKKYNLDDNFVGNLIPIGGGKDSIVTLELLKGMDNTCFMYKRNIYPDDLASLNAIKLSGNESVAFELTLDELMLKLNKEGFYNGHIPFSSTLAFASYIMAYVNNKKYIVLSNESSANETNIKDSYVNHQYSKSFEFEKDFRWYTDNYFSSKIQYFSLLRCLNEYQIVKEFVKHEKYLDIFRSCNVGMKTNTWCGHCAKCLYVYIMLYPFINEEKLIDIFGNNMLDNKDNLDLFLSLICEDKNKPFECVGTKDEINYALTKSLEKDNLPYLIKYYKENLYDSKRIYNIEKYFNKNNLIPKEYLERMGYYEYE